MPRVPKTAWLAELEDATEPFDFDDGWDPMAEIRLDHIRNKREAGEPMSRRDLALEQVDGEELLFADGYDDAILGVVYRDGVNVVVYDRTKVLQILEKDMTPEEAVEFFEFNVAGAYVGPQTPIFLELLSEETAGQGITASADGDSICPQCAQPKLMVGYGLAGGGMGTYWSCEACGYWKKEQDPPEE